MLLVALNTTTNTYLLALWIRKQHRVWIRNATFLKARMPLRGLLGFRAVKINGSGGIVQGPKYVWSPRFPKLDTLAYNPVGTFPKT